MEDKKHQCEECGRKFKTNESLEQHRSSAHPSKSKRINPRKIRNWAIFFIIVGILAVVITWSFSGTIEGEEECRNLPAEEINIGGHVNLALHTHQELEIVIDGINQQIPANIGITSGVMRPVHTHDSTGEVHVEGPCKRDFTLGDFFTVWGKEFSSEKILDKATEEGTLKFYVNGQENSEFENLVLKDGQRIRIEYKTSG